MNRMLLREMAGTKGQFFAAAAVILAGITMYAACYMSYKNLKNSMDTYYQQYRFLDYYAQAESISSQVVSRITEVKGVREAAGRICTDIGADMGEDTRVTLRLISVPDGKTPPVNDLFLISGRYPKPGHRQECLISQKFAEYYRLEAGSKEKDRGFIRAIIHGEAHEFRVVGVVASPEFVYAMKSCSSISPSAGDFGIVYINKSAARSILGREDSFNELHVLFREDADREAAIDAIEKALKACGFKTGIERKDQSSHIMFDGEVRQYEQIAYLFPALFLTVAALIIHVMLRRMVANQRSRIGVMKAFGYSDGSLLWYYIRYALLIAVVGSLPGAVLGTLLGRFVTGIYNQIFSIPVMQVSIYWEALLIGIALSAFFCLAAAWSSARRLMSIHPAQAMRPEVPDAGKRIWLDRIGILWSKLPFGWKMSVRNVFRNAQRALLTTLGIAFTIMFFIISFFFLDSIDFILTHHFFETQRQDYKVTFSRPVPYHQAMELKGTDGVRRLEPFAELPVQIRKDWRKEDTLVIGVSGRNRFYRVEDEVRQPVNISGKGIWVAQTLAEKLELTPGDLVQVKVYTASPMEKQVRIAGIIKQYAGFNSYMSLDEMAGLMDQERFATGVLLDVQYGWDRAVKKALFEYRTVESVESRMGAYNAFLSFMQLMYAFIAVMIVFGSIMGFAIVFNTTVINVMERQRELASLKVLGYTRKEIERTIYRENVMLGLLAVLPGVILGQTVSGALTAVFSTELFAMEVVIYPRTYLISILCVFVFIPFAVRANRKSISGLDMVEVLKNREG